MIAYKFTICRDEKHFDYIIDVLKKKGHTNNITYDNIKNSHTGDPHHIALFWEVGRPSGICWGHTGYTSDCYTREDIEMNVVPEGLFTL